MPNSALVHRPKGTKTTRRRASSPLRDSRRVQKRCSPRLSRSKTVREAIDIKTFERQSVHDTSHIKAYTRTLCFLEDLASDSDYDTDMEEGNDADDEFGELSDLSGDNIQYNSADQLDRRESYDSRLESDNEDYELDDFVVDDDSDDTITEVGSEITVTPERLDESGDGTEDTDDKLSSTTARKHSATSTGSSNSGLFVSDPDDVPEALSSYLTPMSPLFVQPVPEDVEPAEVAEEIMDAVCRFSRRCNRDSAPLRLFLTSEYFEDKEVEEAVRCAVEKGLGWVDDVWGAEGRVKVIVGPRM